jgi:TatA/E family protein of Tat protein translocase
MQMGIENPVHILFIAIVALIVLGPKRLPELTRALGAGIREFREAVGQGVQQPPAAPPAPVAGEILDPVQTVPSEDAPDRSQL